PATASSGERGGEIPWSDHARRTARTARSGRRHLADEAPGTDCEVASGGSASQRNAANCGISHGGKRRDQNAGGGRRHAAITGPDFAGRFAESANAASGRGEAARTGL